MGCSPIHYITTPKRMYATIKPGLLHKERRLRHPHRKTIESIITQWDEELSREKDKTNYYLERYLLANIETLMRLPTIREQYEMIIFIPGSSVTSTNTSAGPPRRVGIDPQSTLHKLSTILLEEHEKRVRHDKEHATRAENILYIPVAPVLWPFSITIQDDKAVLNHAQPSIINDINHRLRGKNKEPFGTLTKTLSTTTTHTNYVFSDILLEPAKTRKKLSRDASHFYKTHARITNTKEKRPQRDIPVLTEITAQEFESIRSITQEEVNALRALMATFYANVITMLGITRPEDVIVYSAKGSSTYKVIERATKHLFNKEPRLIGGPSGPHRLHKGTIPQLDMAEPSAIGALFGYIKAVFDHKEQRLTTPLTRRREHHEELPPFKNCHYQPLILCQRQEKCDSKQHPCAYTQFKGLPRETQRLLIEDAHAHNAGIYEGIEALIRILNTEEHEVTTGKGTTSLSRIIKEVQPLPFTDMEEEHTLLRASGFNNKCHLAAYISSNNKTITRNLGIKIPEEERAMAIAGEAIHHIMLLQHRDENGKPVITESNRILESIGQPIITREQYCEKTIITTIHYKGETIKISGHADTTLTAISPEGEKNIMILDIKRNQTPHKKGPLYQVATYAEGLEEYLNYGSRHHYPVIMNRKFIPPHAKKTILHATTHQPPTITIKQITPYTDELIQERNKLAYQRLRITRSMISDKEVFLAYKHHEEQRHTCEGCLTKRLCDELAKRAEDTHNKQYLGDIAGITTEH